MLVDKQGLTEQQFLARYNPGDFPRPSLTVDMAVYTVSGDAADSYRKLPSRTLQVLLVKRGAHPFLGCWALPGGFVRPGETAGQAAARELQEEAGVTGIYLEQLYTFSAPGRDPRTWVVSCAHMALVDSGKLQVKGGDDADEAAWFQMSCRQVPGTTQYRMELRHGDTCLEALVDAGAQPSDGESFELLQNSGLAFDHAKILLYALLRLRGKVTYSPVALHLVPEQFTLGQLQQVYEEILGKPLLAPAFRRKIADFVEETGAYTKNAGHRPSQLFRRKQAEEVSG